VKDIRLHIDGAPHDGVGHDLASQETLARFKEAEGMLSELRAPILVRARHRNERLFIAAFDGTGNNKFLDPHHATNVAKIDDAVVSQGLFTDAHLRRAAERPVHPLSFSLRIHGYEPPCE